MTQKACPHVWYELMTNDAPAAEAFYREVVGWRAQNSGMTDRSYTILSVGETSIGGLMPLPAEARAGGAAPLWMGYIGVDDVDAYVARVVAAGGTLHRAAEDIPGVGRFAVVADPHGAPFVLFRGASDQAPAPVKQGTLGHIGWHELLAGEGKSAVAFYTDLFGWAPTTAMDMGALGSYQLFNTGGEDVGGIMTKMPDTPRPFWLYYINVDAIDAAVARATSHGAKVITGPGEVPGGSWIVRCIDPQGAVFAMVAPKR